MRNSPIRSRAVRPWRRLVEDREGAVAIAFGLVLLPLVGIAGAAVDYSRLTADRADLQRAADAAAIAAARAGDGVDLDALAEDVVTANVADLDGFRIADIDHSEKDGVHTVAVDALRKGVFSRVLGVGDQTVGVSAAATRGAAGLPTEIAIVFDVTNSMTFGNAWAAATGTMVDTLERLRGLESDAELYVSMVPTSDRVNLSRMVPGAAGAYDWLTGTLPDEDWNGCLEPRSVSVEGVDMDGNPRTFPDALDDAPPTGDTRFRATIRENMPAIHVGQSYRGNRLPTCSQHALVPPTTRVAEIQTALAALSNAGTGRFDIGLAWGWRLLSPRWSGEWGIDGYPAPYGDRQKIVLFVTDGRTNAYRREVLPEGAVNPAGNVRGYSHTYGNNQGSPNAFTHLVDLCSRMKDVGVRIIMLQIDGNDHFDDYARACASSAEDYFLIDKSTSLTTALSQIGDGGGDVRLVR